MVPLMKLKFYDRQNQPLKRTFIWYKAIPTHHLHRIMIWRQQKKDHLRTVFFTSEYRYPEVENIFVNISVKTKKSSKIFWDVDLGTRCIWFMKKTVHFKIPHYNYLYPMLMPSDGVSSTSRLPQKSFYLLR